MQRIKFLQAVLNKTLHDGYKDPEVTHTLHGTHVDATILLEGEDVVDGPSTNSNAQLTIYETIAQSNIQVSIENVLCADSKVAELDCVSSQELKSHPCFAAVVNRRWETLYYQYLHWSVYMYRSQNVLIGLLLCA